MVKDSLRETQYRAIRDAVTRNGLTDTWLTASDVYDLVREDPVGFSSAHEVATVLGQHRDEPALEVEEGSPYRYRFSNI